MKQIHHGCIRFEYDGRFDFGIMVNYIEHFYFTVKMVVV